MSRNGDKGKHRGGKFGNARARTDRSGKWLVFFGYPRVEHSRGSVRLFGFALFDLRSNVTRTHLIRSSRPLFAYAPIARGGLDKYGVSASRVERDSFERDSAYDRVLRARFPTRSNSNLVPPRERFANFCTVVRDENNNFVTLYGMQMYAQSWTSKEEEKGNKKRLKDVARASRDLRSSRNGEVVGDLARIFFCLWRDRGKPTWKDCR